MDKYFVEIGENVQLIDSNGELYTSMVQEVEDAFTCKISGITKGGVFRRMPVGTRFSVMYMRKSAGFTFVGKVIGEEKQDNLLMVTLQRISDIERKQRRSCYRLEKVMPVLVSLYEMFDLTKIEKKLQINARDISEEGLGLRSNIPIEVGRFVDCRFILDDEEMNLRYQVVRCVKDVKKFVIGLYLLDKDKEIRRKLRKFIYREQLKL